MVATDKPSKSSCLVSHVELKEAELVQDAAAILGVNISDFLREVAIERAQEVVTSYERIELTPQGQAQIIDAIKNPPPFNSELLEIAKQIRCNEHGKSSFE